MLLSRLRELGEGSSLHGLPKIISSNLIVIKVLWTLIVIGASVLLGLQLDALYKEYTKFPTKTSINVGYGTLEFPSVTVCNINPIKLSKLHYFPNASAIIRGPKQSAETVTRTSANLDNAMTSESSSRRTDDDDDDITRNPADLNNTGTSESSTRRPDDDDITRTPADLNNTGTSESPQRRPERQRSKSGNNVQEPTEAMPSEDLDQKEQSSSKSRGEFSQPQNARRSWTNLRRQFLIALRDAKQSLRIIHGNGKNGLILVDKYQQQPLPKKYVKPVLSGEYGTCYTIEVGIDIDTAGSDAGLELVLFTDTDEYIEEPSDGYGVKVTIHERGTFPMPKEEGLLLNPGYLTSIGMRRKTIERYGPPYSQCIGGQEFKEKHGFEYSISVCLAICRKEKVWENCGCVPYLSPEVIGLDTDRKVCPWKDKCLERTDEDIKADVSSCNCLAKCHENIYESHITSMRWPSPTYLQYTIYDDVCLKNISSLNKTCEDLRTKLLNITDANYKTFAENFASLRIFYESLVHETITEEPLYSTITFLSDVGGSMGLFLGASLITYLELIHLLVELLICLCKRCCRKNASVNPAWSPSSIDALEKEFYLKRP